MARIEKEQGALHILVNDIWGATKMEWNKTVWESDLEYGLRTLRLAIDTHAITSHFALPLLIRKPGGLVVEVTDGTDDYNATNYRVSFFYDIAKAANLRMAFALAHELKPHGATAVSAHPRLAAIGGHARRLRGRGSELAGRDEGPTRTSPSPRARPSSVARWRRWRAIPTSRAGTASRSPAASSRRSTASPTSTAAGPTRGAYVVEVQDAGKPADVTGYR